MVQGTLSSIIPIVPLTGDYFDWVVIFFEFIDPAPRSRPMVHYVDRSFRRFFIVEPLFRTGEHGACRPIKNNGNIYCVESPNVRVHKSQKCRMWFGNVRTGFCPRPLQDEAVLLIPAFSNSREQ